MRGVLRNQPKVSILVQQDRDRQDGRTEAFVGEDYFHQDKIH